jgi:hypothetical protein
MDPEPDPANFVIDLQGEQFFCLLLFEGTFFTSFFKDKKSKRSHKTGGIKVFLNFFS